ncbi:cysteine desulfurase family protein [Corynebacterium flavescens]|uniref:cysteine desulfurase family protein n=1 Tax=Corynebacterium flavescens TaxID=28028 RepID=UPI003FD41670
MISRYLDAAASAPLRPEARATMLEVYDAFPGNPASVHSYGQRAHAVVENARTQVAQACGVDTSEVIFTSGGTEANNLAVAGIALANPRGRRLVTTRIEHPSILETCRYLEKMHGFKVDYWDVDAAGRVCSQPLAPDTALVAMALANSEVGTVQKLPQVAGVPLLVDAVQAAPALPVSLAAGAWPGPGAGIAAMALASHKFGGPQGVGALIVRRGVAVSPQMHGGGQEQGLRSGTLNVAGIAGFGAAVAALQKEGIGTRAQALVHSRERLIAGIVEQVPRAQLTGHRSERLPGHASFVFPGISGEAILVALDVAGFAVSSGSACAAGSTELSPVLLACGFDADTARSAVRFTLPEPLPPAEVDRIVEIVARECVAGGPC